MKADLINRPDELLVTICCRQKDPAPGRLPAVERYRSGRIQRLARLASECGLPYAILSGLYGLIDAQEPIPDYDRLLQPEAIEAIAELSRVYLEERAITGVFFCLPNPAQDPNVHPYREVMEQATRGRRLRVFLLPPDPTPEQLCFTE